MKGAVLHAPGDIRVETRDDPAILRPTDAVLRLSATCVCGSDLWDYRGINPLDGPTPMGHEYCGIVEEVGSAVGLVEPGQFVIGSFFTSDNTCPHCRAGYQSSCQHGEFVGASGAQAELLRVPLADGTLVATPDMPDADLVPSLLAASDVLGTGWWAATAAGVTPGSTVADAVLECVGTPESMSQALRSARPGGGVGVVGVPHGVSIDGEQLFYSHVRVQGGPAPVRRFLPELVDLVLSRQIDPGAVFDLTLPLDRAAEGYAAMDERRAIKTLLQP